MVWIHWPATHKTFLLLMQLWWWWWTWLSSACNHIAIILSFYHHKLLSIRMDFKVDHIVYKEGNVDLYLKVTMIGTSNVHHNICAWLHHAHAHGFSMRLCLAMPWTCAWCSHGCVHGIATSKRVVYLPRGYTIGKHAPPPPLAEFFRYWGFWTLP